jgi:hypothetical protein
MKSHDDADDVDDEVVVHDVKRELPKVAIPKKPLKPVTTTTRRPTTKPKRSPPANQAKPPKGKTVNHAAVDDDECVAADPTKPLLDLKLSKRTNTQTTQTWLTTGKSLARPASLKKTKKMKRSSSQSATREFLRGKRRFRTCSDVPAIRDRVLNNQDFSGPAHVSAGHLGLQGQPVRDSARTGSSRTQRLS